MIDLSRLLKNDMNLLVCLYVLLQERSVSRAADKLYLSQSAVSKQLTKLRQVFDDPLFERESKGLLPTPKALSLEAKLQQILLQVDQLSDPDRFEPESSTRSFNIDLIETAYSTIYPRFLPEALAEAPNITINSRDWNENSIQRLQRREVDFGIGIFEWDSRAKTHVETIPESLSYVELMRDASSCVMRKGHPALDEEWSLETFLKYRHIQVVTGGVNTWLLHEVLADKRLKLDNAVNMSDIASAVRMCEKSDLLTTYPYECVREFVDKAEIVVKRLPLDLEPGGQFLLWNKQFDSDPSHKWLRELIINQFSD
ncbi:LysR family transcriptional regulator [Photobacterium sp. BZF1]|uniref:LysR substrate-binding domain-containing protein n=1 Tax=Photobacterium sp. BZF1 TaxID=1904457 RepID=UPI0016534C5B|nr:LysR substrate-binding domain-containing protein [Photobacterium sp. BZF1]MBC7002971.1 LysR family transcriptional regulator [Photobacterium sp. BZF1]